MSVPGGGSAAPPAPVAVSTIRLRSSTTNASHSTRAAYAALAHASRSEVGSGFALTLSGPSRMSRAKRRQALSRGAIDAPSACSRLRARRRSFMACA
jgi:hypothetical protein